PGQRQPGRRVHVDLRDRHRPGRAGGRRAGVATAPPRGPELLQRVPGTAVRTLPGPADGLPSALPADERDARLRHGVPTLAMVVADLQVISVTFPDAGTLCGRKRPGNRSPPPPSLAAPP